MQVKFGFLVLGIAAVLAACGSAGTATTGAASKASPSPSGRAGRGLNTVTGQLVQLNGSSLVLSTQSGDTTVTFSSSTRVQQTVTGTSADIVAGMCTNVSGPRDATGTVTASVVAVSPPVNGVCGGPAGGGGGNGGGGGANGGGAGNGQGRFPNAGNAAFVRGQVTAVSGTTITVTPGSGSPVMVTVPASARITKVESASTSRLATGQCIAANGQRDASGTVHARSLSITTAGPNGCTFGGFGGPRGQPTQGTQAT